MSTAFNIPLPRFTTSTFHHVVLSISGTTHTIYYDGVQKNQTTNQTNIFTNNTSAISAILGCKQDKTQGYNGFIGDFKVYNSAISSNQVSSLYLNSNLVVYYKFDISLNTDIPNNALLVYDASLSGSTFVYDNSIKGNVLSLTNTNFQNSISYLLSTPNFNNQINWTNGLTISSWINTLGFTNNNKMTLFDIPYINNYGNPNSGITLDISGNNIISCQSISSFDINYLQNVLGLKNPVGMCIIGNYLYVANSGYDYYGNTNMGTNSICRINLIDIYNDSNLVWLNLNRFNPSTLFNINTDGTNLYVGGLANGTGYFLKITTASSPNITILLNGNGSAIDGVYPSVAFTVNGARGALVNGGYLYWNNALGANQLNRINLSTLVCTTFANSTQGIISSAFDSGGITIFGNYMYVVNNLDNGNSTISKISITNPTGDFVANWFPSNTGQILKNSVAIVYFQNYLYVSSFNLDGKIAKISITTPTTDYNLTWMYSNNFNYLFAYNNDIYGLGLNVITRIMMNNNPNTISSSLSSPFTTNAYRNVCLTILGNIITLYLDGVQVATRTDAPNFFLNYPNISKMYIGTRSNLTYGFIGNIKEFKIFTRTFSASEVLSLFNLRF